MEKTISLRELFTENERFLDKNVRINGWIRTNRDSKTFGFIVLHDGTFFEPIQVVYNNGLNNFDAICKINNGIYQ